MGDVVEQLANVLLAERQVAGKLAPHLFRKSTYYQTKGTFWLRQALFTAVVFGLVLLAYSMFRDLISTAAVAVIVSMPLQNMRLRLSKQSRDGGFVFELFLLVANFALGVASVSILAVLHVSNWVHDLSPRIQGGVIDKNVVVFVTNCIAFFATGRRLLRPFRVAIALANIAVLVAVYRNMPLRGFKTALSVVGLCAGTTLGLIILRDIYLLAAWAFGACRKPRRADRTPKPGPKKDKPKEWVTLPRNYPVRIIMASMRQRTHLSSFAVGHLLPPPGPAPCDRPPRPTEALRSP